MSVYNKTCFVIMPFSATKSHSQDYWKKHFELFLKPRIENFEEVKASRSEPLRGSIASQIILGLIRSDIVIADLTDHNPNVLWELGVRQSFKHCTITIAELNTSIPFHFSQKGILFYDSNHLDDTDFEKRFTAAIKDCLDNPDSPVLETINGRGTLYEIVHRDESIRRMTALISECDWNIGILNEIYERIKENIKNPEERKAVTGRLVASCTELLITTRYLDEDESFYLTVQNCFIIIDAINEQLNQWGSNWEGVEEWFLGSKEDCFKRFVEHKKIIEDAQKRLTEKRY